MKKFKCRECKRELSIVEESLVDFVCADCNREPDQSKDDDFDNGFMPDMYGGGPVMDDLR